VLRTIYTKICEFFGKEVKPPRLAPQRVADAMELLQRHELEEVSKMTRLSIKALTKIKEGTHPTQLRLVRIEPKRISSGRHLKLIKEGRVEFEHVPDETLTIESMRDYKCKLCGLTMPAFSRAKHLEERHEIEADQKVLKSSFEELEFSLDLRVVRSIREIMPKATKRVRIQPFAPSCLRWAYEADGESVSFYVSPQGFYHIPGENRLNYDALRHRAGIVFSIYQQALRRVYEDDVLKARLGIVV